MKFFKPHKKLFRIEKLSSGFPYATKSGMFLNSPRVWREVGTIRANDIDDAVTRAAHMVGSSQIRVTEDETGEYL